MDTGIISAAGTPIVSPLAVSWLGRADAPPTPPGWSNIQALSNKQIQRLQSQIAYDLSGWDYSKIGPNNELGRYQFSTDVLETYGVLAPGANATYGIDCVNYLHVWQPVIFNNGINNYQNYFYNINSLNGFLSSTVAQEHLAYQRLADLYIVSRDIGAIINTDSAGTVAGMMYVAWTLGVGASPTIDNPQGTGAWAWRYNGVGPGINSYNSGRYAMSVLSV